MGKFKDLTGQKFGRLTVIERAPTKNKRTMWKCVCSCPNKTIFIVDSANLTSGHTKSCKCLNNERIGNLNKTHHKTDTRLHRIWGSMKQRCYNPKNNRYKTYGAEGKTVCEEWQEFAPFYDWAMANGYRNDLTIERIDETKGYLPENCRWATQKEQQNNRRNNHLITYNGKTQTIAQWADDIGIKYQTLLRRINVSKWNIEKAFKTPVK